MSCKWDSEAGDYLVNGKPCRRDDYGDPTRHCTARRTCSVHIGRDELTCPRCIGRTRADIRWIENLAALMPIEALVQGVNSEAANIAGPAGDPLVLSWRRINHAQASGTLIGDGIEETAPTEVLGIWQAMLSEDYGHPLPDRITLITAAAYLDRNLTKVANDPEQDFPLLAREIRKSRTHLESVLHNSGRPERGAPCPECTSETSGLGPRLVRKYPHWCDDEDCTQQFHYSTVLDGLTGEARPDTSGDWWVCPRNRDHAWSHEDYARWIEDRETA